MCSPEILGARLAIVCLVVAGVCATSSVAAQQMSYKLRDRVEPGERPAVILVMRESIERLTVVLTRDDGKAFKFKKRRPKVGNEIVFTFPQKAGKRHYTASIEMTLSDGRLSKANAEFDIVVAARVEIDIDWSRSGIDRKQLTFVASGRLEKATMKVLGPAGLIDDVEVSLSAFEPGAALVLPWTGDGEVHRISVKFEDRWGFWQGFESVRVDIPHEEVIFDSGKSSFKGSEAAKLDETYRLIVAELGKYDELPISLYVGGYTDTVGAKAGNLTLSFARARAIATYFRRKGLRTPILYQGFGEDVLAVATADEVDEQRNRRAVYILSNAPPVSAQLPSADWRVLR
jgi:flagellar motor protein MotB